MLPAVLCFVSFFLVISYEQLFTAYAFHIHHFLPTTTTGKEEKGKEEGKELEEEEEEEEEAGGEGKQKKEEEGDEEEGEEALSAMPKSLSYTSKAILLFQKVDGCDLCLFSMYVLAFPPSLPPSFPPSPPLTSLLSAFPPLKSSRRAHPNDTHICP